MYFGSGIVLLACLVFQAAVAAEDAKDAKEPEDSKECVPLRARDYGIGSRCFYMCRIGVGRLKLKREEEGKPCSIFGRPGSCIRGLCLLDDFKKYLEERKRLHDEKKVTQARRRSHKKTGNDPTEESDVTPLSTATESDVQ
ncbi:uncharacterized protein LOC135399550 [Ornithodoros turicata]|uniref:uncharacterized protein LOC135399550 n=1 Tax=Ornithodoros turicata TaxID=34597 RepID=UPI003138D998